MMYTVDQVADWFLSRLNTEAGDTISPLKLQKLVYYAQAWHLTAFQQPLFEEDIQAWAHGPVIPGLYHRFRETRRECSIKTEDHGLEKVEFSSETEQLLTEIHSIYGEHSASYLEMLTHNESPWIDARKGLEAYERSAVVITKDAMIKYYSNLKDGK